MMLLCTCADSGLGININTYKHSRMTLLFTALGALVTVLYNILLVFYIQALTLRHNEYIGYSLCLSMIPSAAYAGIVNNVMLSILKT